MRLEFTAKAILKRDSLFYFEKCYFNSILQLFA